MDRRSADYSGNVLNDNKDCLNIACANARSLVLKVDSLITLFDENSLQVALITETWLSSRHCPPRVLADLTHGANVNYIRRDRGSMSQIVCLIIQFRAWFILMTTIR